MSANNEKCADQDKRVCGYNEFGRLRYFHGMLLNDTDFKAEQEYHARKRRLLNRALHGSGVVCGLDLTGKKDGDWIKVSSGLALDCSGNEIWVPEDRKIDLKSLIPPKKGKPDPDCKEDDDKGEIKTYYIGIRYEEKPSNPVSVYLSSGSCEQSTCENSRFKEGYCIEIAQCCPEKYPVKGFLKAFCDCGEGFNPKPEEVPLCPDYKELEGTALTGQYRPGGKKLCQSIRLEEFCEQSVPCPECCSCDTPCHVILGKIQVNEKCQLVSLCMNECRRYVLTGRMFQHLLTGLLAGGEDYFKMDVNGKKIAIPELDELAHNPIKALCWFLRYKLIEGGDFEVNLCGVKKDTQQHEEIGTQLNTMRKDLETVKQQQYSVLNRVIEVNKLTAPPEMDLGTAYAEVLEAKPAEAKPVDVKTAEVKQPATKTPKPGK
jgi:hypothetical protein